jgi:hypothetical protein
MAELRAWLTTKDHRTNRKDGCADPNHDGGSLLRNNRRRFHDRNNRNVINRFRSSNRKLQNSVSAFRSVPPAVLEPPDDRPTIDNPLTGELFDDQDDHQTPP